MRSNGVQDTYINYLAQSDPSTCIFCHTQNLKIVKEYSSFFLVENQFPYTTFDFQQISRHLLLIPKIHVHQLSELDKDAQQEWLSIILAMQSDGFTVMSRSPKNLAASVPHLHTHLFELNGCIAESISYTEKPYSLDVKYK